MGNKNRSDAADKWPILAAPPDTAGLVILSRLGRNMLWAKERDFVREPDAGNLTHPLDTLTGESSTDFNVDTIICLGG